MKVRLLLKVRHKEVIGLGNIAGGVTEGKTCHQTTTQPPRFQTKTGSAAFSKTPPPRVIGRLV